LIVETRLVFARGALYASEKIDVFGARTTKLAARMPKEKQEKNTGECARGAWNHTAGV
jgi:hypothetical protein